MAAVTLRYWAAAKEAAGVAEEQVEALTLADALRAAVLARGGTAPLGALSSGALSSGDTPDPDGPDPDGPDPDGPDPDGPDPDGPEPPAMARAAPAAGGAGRAERYALVLARSSFLINGDPVGKRPPESVPLPEGAVIEVLPPFAGG